MLTADALRSYLPACGYEPSLLRQGYRFAAADLERRVAWAAFSQNPPDARSACLAAADVPSPDAQHAADLRDLGTPTLFACYGNELYWFQHDVSGTRLLERIAAAHIAGFFEEHKEDFAPQRIYRAKSSAKFIASRQLDFVDVGLMPLLERASGERLGRMVESLVAAVQSALPGAKPSKAFARWLFQSVFWLLAARLLRDKSVPSFKTVDVADPADVFDRVARHYNAKAPPITSPAERRAIAAAANVAAGFPSLGNITTESLAYVYENTLVSAEARNALGTHSTPPWLVDYVIWQLAPWIEELAPENRHVLEPACGHSAFLVAAVRLLRELSPETLDEKKRLRYLREHVHGIEVDEFAREIGRLSLTLSDVPNPNGWDLTGADMFAGPDLAKQVKRAGIVLSNPPFEDFSEQERRHYKRQPGLGIVHNNKAAELFTRVTANLPVNGVFGMVVPQAVLTSRDAREFRERLVRDFELREICLFPDKVFENSSVESAVVLGRRRSPSLRHSVYYRRVREWDMESFEQRLEASSESQVPQSSFLLRSDTGLRLPDLQEIWEALSACPRLADAVVVEKGFEFKNRDLLGGRQVTADRRRSGWKKAFLRADSDYPIWGTPEVKWVDYSLSTLRRPGAEPGQPQVVVNYAPTSRKPWRLKAVLDPHGHVVSSRFLSLKPKATSKLPLITLWAILNSPLANAYGFAVSGKRQTLPKEWKQFPMPKFDEDSTAQTSEAAEAYRAAAKSHAEGFFNGPTEVDVRNLLLQMDAAVLRAYGLKPALEQQLLALFEDVERVGVSCPFTSYPRVPTSVHLPFHLRIQLPRFHELSSLRLAGKITSQQAAELRKIEDGFDQYEKQASNGSAFRRWLQQLDDRQDRIRSKLNAIEASLAKRTGGSGS